MRGAERDGQRFKTRLKFLQLVIAVGVVGVIIVAVVIIVVIIVVVVRVVVVVVVVVVIERERGRWQRCKTRLKFLRLVAALIHRLLPKPPIRLFMSQRNAPPLD